MVKPVALLGFLVFFNDCARNPVTGKRQFSLMSEGQEMSLGKESDPQVLSEFGMYPDSNMQNYLNVRGQAMAKISHRPNLPFQFKVVDSDVVNAFAVPGGYVYFTRGIMAHFNSEAQLMGVLGHEIGHVTARHSAQQYTNQTFTQLGLVVGMIAFPKFQQFGDLASTGLQLMFLKFSRDHESQSDKLGVEYSSKLGYDAHEMAGFFNTLGRLSAGEDGAQRIPTFMSSHPDPGDRYTKVKAMATDFQLKNQGTYRTERESYLRLIDGIVYGEDPRQGYVESNTFYHPELKFQFPIPTGWKHVNTPSQIQMASPDQKAMMLMAVSNEKTLNEAAKSVVDQYKLRVLDQRNVQINGMQAIVQVADQLTAEQQQAAQQGQAMTPRSNGMTKTNGGQTNGGQSTGTKDAPTAPSGSGGGGQTTSTPSNQGNQAGQTQGQGQAAQTTRVQTVLIQYNGLIYRFHGIASSVDFPNFERLFSNTMQGFNTLTDPAKINVKEDHIRLRTSMYDGTLTDVLRGFGVAESKYKEISILNGLALTDRVPSGTMLKVIGK
ncbi:MAG: M48 family metalloprotease [Saprospiraceae bacterium]|nr:M48 family metalloprotease [Saprospiraceae bacterium]